MACREQLQTAHLFTGHLDSRCFEAMRRPQWQLTFGSLLLGWAFPVAGLLGQASWILFRHLAGRDAPWPCRHGACLRHGTHLLLSFMTKVLVLSKSKQVDINFNLVRDACTMRNVIKIVTSWSKPEPRHLHKRKH